MKCYPTHKVYKNCINFCHLFLFFLLFVDVYYDYTFLTVIFVTL